MKKKILLGLTTITKGLWKDKVKEIDKLGLKKIALFPTCLNLKQRKILYKLLENTGLKSISHVHLREQDFERWELDYLVRKYKTRVFNIHNRDRAKEFLEKNKKYRKIIFLENTVDFKNFAKNLKLCGGICLDLSHYEDHANVMKPKEYEMFGKLLKVNKIGINHVSAMSKNIEVYHDNFSGKDYYGKNTHWFSDFKEFDYVKKYKKYLADIISIELENPLKQQLEVKRYLEKIFF